MAKFIHIALIAFLGVIGVNASADQCPASSTGLILNTLLGIGINITISSDSNQCHVTTSNGLQLQISIDLDGFLILGIDGQNHMTPHCSGSNGTVEYGKNSTGSPGGNTCKFQKFPDGYLLNIAIDAAIKLHKEKKSWNDARRTCESEGGHLLVINTEVELAIILKLLLSVNLNTCWLGIHDLFQVGDWVSILDVPLLKLGIGLDLSGLLGGLLNKPASSGRCGCLTQKGQMSPADCSSQRSFICKIPCKHC